MVQDSNFAAFADKFSAHELNSCLAMTLRATLRMFPAAHRSANYDLNRSAMFVFARCLLSAVSFLHFPRSEMKRALMQSLDMVQSDVPVFFDALEADCSKCILERSKAAALKAIERANEDFFFNNRNSFWASVKAENTTPRPEPFKDAKSAALANTVSDFRYEFPDVLSRPLWEEGTNPLIGQHPDHAFASFLSGEVSAFWREWYQGFLDGKPLDWELQRRVALIPDTDWAQGPEHIAKLIEEIRARFDVETAAKQVESYLERPAKTGAAAANPMIGHNNPPEGEELPLSPPEFKQLLGLVQSLQVQMQSDTLDTHTIEAAAEEVEAAQAKIGGWLSEGLKLSREEFFKEFGKWGGRMAIAGLTAAGIWFFGLLVELTPLLQALQWVLAKLTG